MPLAIADPIGILRECHRRIETSLTVLASAARLAHESLLDDQQLNAAAALSYLREAAPRHMADEEESLFPRLRRQRDSCVLPVLARIESLEEEHVCADRLHVEMDALGRKWLKSGTLPVGEASRFSTLLAQLSDLYRHHIAIEDAEVFPIASATLPATAIEAIASEMVSRWHS